MEALDELVESDDECELIGEFVVKQFGQPKAIPRLKSLREKYEAELAALDAELEELSSQLQKFQAERSALEQEINNLGFLSGGKGKS